MFIGFSGRYCRRFRTKVTINGLKFFTMFENLSDRLSRSFKKITGKARLNHDNIKDALSDVRKALLEADVALPVVKE